MRTATVEAKRARRWVARSVVVDDAEEPLANEPGERGRAGRGRRAQVVRPGSLGRPTRGARRARVRRLRRKGDRLALESQAAAVEVGDHGRTSLDPGLRDEIVQAPELGERSRGRLVGGCRRSGLARRANLVCAEPLSDQVEQAVGAVAVERDASPQVDLFRRTRSSAARSASSHVYAFTPTVRWSDVLVGRQSLVEPTARQVEGVAGLEHEIEHRHAGSAELRPVPLVAQRELDGGARRRASACGPRPGGR